MPDRHLPISSPDWGKHELGAVTDLMLNRQGRECGCYAEYCEELVADYTKRRYALMTNSGSTALLAASMAMHESGGRITGYLPELTFVAAAEAASWAGIEPTMCDVDPQTWCGVGLRGSGNGVAYPTYLHGAVPEIPNGGDNCIVDAAEGFGSVDGQGRVAGTIGQIVCFSFNGSKTIAGGQAGMIVTDDVDMAAYMREFLMHGRVTTADGSHMRGINGWVDGHAAATVYAQLKRSEELVADKDQVHDWYVEMLDGWTLQESAKGTMPCWWLTSVLLPEGAQAADAVLLLREQGIDARRLFRPVSSLVSKTGLPLYAAPSVAASKRAHPVAYRLYERAICLPSAGWMSRDDVARVCKALREATSRTG